MTVVVRRALMPSVLRDASPGVRELEGAAASLCTCVAVPGKPCDLLVALCPWLR